MSSHFHFHNDRKLSSERTGLPPVWIWHRHPHPLIYVGGIKIQFIEIGKQIFKQFNPAYLIIFLLISNSCSGAVCAGAAAPALAGSPSIRAFVAKSVLTRITRYRMHYFQLFSATSTVKMPVFMKNYKFCWQNCKKNDVYVAKICNGKIRCFCRENLQTRALR